MHVHKHVGVELHFPASFYMILLKVKKKRRNYGKLEDILKLHFPFFWSNKEECDSETLPVAVPQVNMRQYVFHIKPKIWVCFPYLLSNPSNYGLYGCLTQQCFIFYMPFKF